MGIGAERVGSGGILAAITQQLTSLKYSFIKKDLKFNFVIHKFNDEKI